MLFDVGRLPVKQDRFVPHSYLEMIVILSSNKLDQLECEITEQEIILRLDRVKCDPQGLWVLITLPGLAVMTTLSL